MRPVLRILGERMALRVSRGLWILAGIFLLAACGAGGAPEASTSEVSLRAWLDGKPGDSGGTLVLQAVLPHDLTELPLPTPTANGLEISLDDMGTERLGERQVFTWRYAFKGQQGSYEIEPVEIEIPGEDGEPLALSTTSLFVDMGAEPPRVGELVDIMDPSPITEIPYRALLGLSAVGVLGVAGIWIAFGRVTVRKAEAVPTEAPDVAAIRRWEGIRDDASLDDFEKARALSEIFRAYAEAVLQFPASAWTTTQIVARLRAMQHLPEGNLARARRLLRATDRVKYAEQRPGTDFFEDLEADLRAFVGSTRPRTWEDEGA